MAEETWFDFQQQQQQQQQQKIFLLYRVLDGKTAGA